MLRTLLFAALLSLLALPAAAADLIPAAERAPAAEHGSARARPADRAATAAAPAPMEGWSGPVGMDVVYVGPKFVGLVSPMI